MDGPRGDASYCGGSRADESRRQPNVRWTTSSYWQLPAADLHWTRAHAPVPREPCPRRIVAWPQHWIGRGPGARDDGVVHGRTITRVTGVEQLGEQLVEFGARDIQPRPLDPPMQCGLDDRNSLGRPS